MKRKPENRTAAKAPEKTRAEAAAVGRNAEKSTGKGSGKGFIVDGRFECLDATVRPEPGDSYFAVDNQSGQDVVVRIIKGQTPDETQQKAFFERIERLVGLSGNGIEKVLDAGLTPEGSAFVVTERMAGKAISTMIAEGRTFGISGACDIGRQIARALVEAGRAGCAHGHLSTSTVIVVDDGDNAGHEFKVKVTGFTPWEVASTTKPDYAFAPEVILGARPDIRSDCYTLGVILFTLACGKDAFPGTTKEAVALSHLNDKAELPSKVSPDRNIPPALDNLLLRLLDKNPEKRQASPEQILVHLEAIYNSQKAPTVEADEEIVVTRRAPQEHSLIDEGISFASGERISTTDFPAISLSDVLTNASKAKKSEPTAQPKVPKPQETPVIKVAPPVPPPQIVSAQVQPSAGKGISPVLIAVATILVVGLVALSGWYLLDQNAELKRIIEASQKAAATSSQTTGSAAPTPGQPEQVKVQSAPVPAPAPTPVPAPAPAEAAPAPAPAPVQASPAEAVQPPPADTQPVADKVVPPVKEAAPEPVKQVATKPAKAAKPAEPTRQEATQMKKSTVPATRQAEPAEVPPAKPVNKAKMVDWNTGIDDDAAPAQKKSAPAPTPAASKPKPADRKASGDKKAPSDQKPSLNWDD